MLNQRTKCHYAYLSSYRHKTISFLFLIRVCSYYKVLSTGCRGQAAARRRGDELSTHPRFNDDFLIFRQTLTTVSETPNINISIIFEALLHALNTKPNTPEKKTIQAYIQQCLNHISHPLPDNLRSTLRYLETEYAEIHNAPFSLRKQYKLDFLDAFLANIETHPEKTYTECYALTKQAASDEIKRLLDEANPQCLRLFSRFHFKNFITALLAAEPNYNQSHPCSQENNTVSMN